MIWLVVIVGMVVIVLVALALGFDNPPKSAVSYRTMVELHDIRRRFDAAQVKSELRRDGADARRALRDELDGLDSRRRQR